MTLSENSGLPWTVRYAIAAHQHGRPLPSWLLMSVQMVLNGGGCPSCGSARA